MAKPRYYTINVTVEDEDGKVFAVWRSDQPFDSVAAAIGVALGVVEVGAEDAGLGFDRMDDQ